MKYFAPMRKPVKTTALALACLALVATSARRAGAETEEPLLYDDYVAHTEGSAGTRAALEDVGKSCDFSVFSRSGPRPWQVASCERSVARAVALGPQVVPDALRRLNQSSLGYGGRIRTYDVLARVGDVRSLESLVLALPKADPNEADLISSTLSRISYASVAESTPFEHDHDSPDAAALTTLWRAWLKDHRGMSRSALLDERIAQSRARVADGDLETAFIAVRFLCQHKPTAQEGVAAARILLDRPQLPSEAEESLREFIKSTAYEPAKKGRLPKEQLQNAPRASL
jgi:hypothetical protein